MRPRKPHLYATRAIAFSLYARYVGGCCQPEHEGNESAISNALVDVEVVTEHTRHTLPEDLDRHLSGRFRAT